MNVTRERKFPITGDDNRKINCPENYGVPRKVIDGIMDMTNRRCTEHNCVYYSRGRHQLPSYPRCLAPSAQLKEIPRIRTFVKRRPLRNCHAKLHQNLHRIATATAIHHAGRTTVRITAPKAAAGVAWRPRSSGPISTYVSSVLSDVRLLASRGILLEAFRLSQLFQLEIG
jgi:hypothetical protein